MSEQQKATQWDAEPAYIGDDVYRGIDIVTDIDDIDGNPLVVCVQNGSKAQDEEVAGRIINAVNSYARHFGPDAVAAAEEDAMGEMIAALEKAKAWARPYLDTPGHDAAARAITDVIDAAIPARVPQESPR